MYLIFHNKEKEERQKILYLQIKPLLNQNQKKIRNIKTKNINRIKKEEIKVIKTYTKLVNKDLMSLNLSSLIHLGLLLKILIN